jgi:hypothetical protein
VGGRFVFRLALESTTGGDKGVVIRYLPWAMQTQFPDWSQAESQVLVNRVTQWSVETEGLPRELSQLNAEWPRGWQETWTAPKAIPQRMRITLADPMGSCLYHWVTHGTLELSGSSITEGIGQGRVPGNLAGAPIDDAVQISDELALEQVFDLTIHEGISVGGSAGLNVAAAIAVARRLGPGHTVVTILCDGGARYQSKLFNPEFLRGKGLPTPPWMS